MSEIPEPEVLQPIEIYSEDLEQIYSTLSSVYHFCLSYDLFNQYKNLSNGVQISPLTKQVKAMQARVKGYLDDAAVDAESKAEENVS